MENPRPQVCKKRKIKNQHMKFKQTFIRSLLVAVISITASQAATVLYSENFDQANGDFLATNNPEVNPNGVSNLESWGAVQTVSGNQLLSVTSSATPQSAHGGLRFGGTRFNWASGATGAAITAAGGFTVAFDWTESGNSGDRWIGWKVGTPDTDNTVINHATMDYSVLLSDTGNIQTFESGVTRGSVANGTVIGTTHTVLLTYLFSSFAVGSTVNTKVTVNGTDYLPQTFTWDEDNVMRMEFHANNQGELIDNLVIATVPEPSSAAMVLGGLGMLALLRRRKQG